MALGPMTQERQGQGPDTAAIIGCLLLHRELIEACGMVYMIVDNRAPEEVGHWPAFAQWWEARRALVGPQQERTDILWVQATHANGLRAIPYYWAGVFVLEAARFLFPKVHFGLIDNDCVPVTLFEVQDLIALAESQFRWPDLIGYRDPDLARSKPGMLLFTEAHLEYNAGLVISIGSPNRPSPIESTSTAEDLAEELEDYRQQLLDMAAPPECPTEASQGGSLFTPLIGAPMEHSLDLAVVWALYGTYMCYQFWPMPGSGQRDSSDHQTLAAITWPKRAHPGSVLPHLEGPCKAFSLPGEHLFQASRIAPDRMRPVIFHAFGKAKLDAPGQLARLARLGWQTLPIALLGMPHCPAAWFEETWKPIGGCSFTGGPCALTGNSAFRCCLLLQWHAIVVPPTPHARKEEDTDVESARTVSETDQTFLERSLLAAAADQNSRESGSSPPETLQTEELPRQRIQLDTPEGLIAGLGYALTRPGHMFQFHQANTAEERSGLTGVHQWSIMLPTSARVAQEVYEPLIGIHYPMLCSVKNSNWQIGTGSIRAEARLATGFRVVNWVHDGSCPETRAAPPPVAVSTI